MDSIAMGASSPLETHSGSATGDPAAGAVQLKRQWLAAWDQSSWQEPLADEVAARSNPLPAPLEGAEATAESGTMDIERQNRLSEPVDLPVQLTLKLQQAASQVSASPNGLASHIGKQRIQSSVSFSQLQFQALAQLQTKKNLVPPRLTEWLHQVREGLPFQPVNWNLSHRGDQVTLWVRDYREKTLPLLRDQLERMRDVLAKNGMTLSRVMVNGQEWTDAQAWFNPKKRDLVSVGNDR